MLLASCLPAGVNLGSRSRGDGEMGGMHIMLEHPYSIARQLLSKHSGYLFIYTERQKKLITSLECHPPKSKAST